MGARVIWKSVLGALASMMLVLAGPAAAAATDWSGPLPTDPALKTGALPNGLRYAVMHGETPKGAVSIRFAVDVGSYEEAQGERGLAHFVEHMAFRATRHFPEGVVEQQLAEIGVGAGRDHNAFTSLFSTLYVIDLPKAEPAHLDLAFRWLRDVADGVVFDAEAVDHERGVILAEKEARNSNDQVAEDRIAAFQAPSLRSVNRAPIGLEEVLRTATPEDLRRFHSRWYRPDTAVVAVAGDLPVEVMEAAVRTAFGDWRADAPPPVRAPLAGPEPTRGLDALSLNDPRLEDRLRICRLRAADPWDEATAAQRRRDTLSGLWLNILDARLIERADRDGEMVDAHAWVDDDDRDVQRTCLQATPNPDNWPAALAALQGELRRLRRDGPTEAELEAAFERARADLRGGVSVVATEATADLADEIVHTLLTRTAFADPRVLLSAYGRSVENLTPADVREAIDRDWTGSGPLIDAMGDRPPSREALMAAWRQAEASPEPAPYVDSPRPKWAYASFGPAGRAIRREVAPDFVRLTFRNGVVLNFKQTAFEREMAEVRVTLGEGRQEIAPAELFKARIAAPLVVAGGLGRQTWREIDAALAPIDWAFDVDLQDEAFTLSAAPMTSNLELQLQVLAAYVSDPGFRPQPAARLKSAVDQAYRGYGSDPASVAAFAVYQAFGPGTGQAPPPREVFGALSAADIDRLFRPALTASPIEVTIVGDVDEAAATGLVAATFGALPPRAAASRKRSDIQALRLPAEGPPPLRLTHQGPPDRAVVGLTWPLSAGGTDPGRDQAVAQLIADILSDALTHEVRDRQGRTYSPDVTAPGALVGDQSMLVAQIETYPADAETVRLEALKVAARLARGDISAAQLEAARKPAVASRTADLQTNAVWADQLAGSSRLKIRLRDLQLGQQPVTAIGLDEVRAAAVRWLAPTPIQVVVTPAPKEAP